MAIKALLIDLSGTLHVGKEATPGAVQAFTRLQQSNIPFRLASNTSKESRAALLDRLHNIGFHNIRPEDLHTMPTNTPENACFRNAHQSPPARSPLLLLSDSAARDFDNESADRHYDSVVVGLAPEKLSYDHLNRAYRILKAPLKKEKALIATHKATYFRDNDGDLSLGPGPFVQALEEAADVKAEVVGKPTQSFFELCLRSLEQDGVSNEDWSSVAVVGDDIKNDLGGAAVVLGLQRILVKTGKYQAGDEKKVERGQEVTAVEDSFASLVDRLLGSSS